MYSKVSAFLLPKITILYDFLFFCQFGPMMGDQLDKSGIFLILNLFKFHFDSVFKYYFSHVLVPYNTFY